MHIYYIVLLIWGAGTSLYAFTGEVLTNRNLPDAVVVYKISGGGRLSGDVNLTVEGESLLCIENGGETLFSKMEITEKTPQTLYFSHHEKNTRKQIKEQIFEVDFEAEKISRHTLSTYEKREDPLQGMQQKGEISIADLNCTLWEKRGVRKCFYSGIPLMTEYHAYGFVYREEAVSVLRDANSTFKADRCSLPEYPVQRFAHYAGTPKTNHMHHFKSFPKRLLEALKVLQKEEEIQEKCLEKKRKKAAYIMGHPVFLKQKTFFPKLLETMKKTRVCLTQAQDTPSANACLAAIRQTLSSKQYWIESWQKEKEHMLAVFDGQITLLESKMRCIRSAMSLEDLTVCIRQ